MFALLRYAFRTLLHNRECTVTLVGLDSAGKTTILNDVKVLLNQLSHLPQDVLPTIGQNICKGVYRGTSFTFRDIAGIQKFRKYWVDNFRDTDIVVFVFDCSMHSRFNESYEEFKALIHSPLLTDAPVVILAHKQDLPNVVSELEVKKLLNCDAIVNHKWATFSSSCGGPIGNHFGVDKMLEWICNYVKSDPLAAQRKAYVKEHTPSED